MEDSSASIVEGRQELMVSPDGKNLKQRMAHFIKPSIGFGSSDKIPVANIPRQFFSSLSTTFESKKWLFEVRFCGWRYPMKNWEAWVVKMASCHESTWKKAGIFEAIMNSTYRVIRNIDLVLGVAEKWCFRTKSFIFSWGEATITLEDVMILGGYSVMGSPVFTPVETEEMKETLGKLNEARKEINRSSYKKVCHQLWERKFMDGDSEIEHEAFLALWLSRFVLPSSYDIVIESVFPIAIHLARGTRIALAPAVLARIYRDLSCVKQNMVASAYVQSNCDDGNVALTNYLQLWSPLSLVQVWIWERFLDLRPEPNLIENGKPRLALWHDLKCKVKDMRSVLDSSKGRFDWRPYVRKMANSDGTKFYGDKEMWILIDSSLDDELLSFAQCLRASELVALDCIEQYLPHRVALQFGMDQDIPGCVSRSNDSLEIAWSDYNKSVAGGKLYIPPRHFEAGVTTRYLEWWKKQSVLNLQETSKDALEEHRSFTNSKLRPRRSEVTNESDLSASFKMILKSLKRPEEDDTRFGFKMTPKKFKGMRGSKRFPDSKMDGKTSKRAKQGNSASTKSTSDLGSSLERLKMVVRDAGFKARSSYTKKKGNNASTPCQFPPKTSTSPSLGSEVNNEGKNLSTSANSVSEPLKELPLSFIIQKELNNSPFPPGFPPKGNMLRAKVSVNDDKVAAPVPPGSIDEYPPFPPGFPLKEYMLQAKDSSHENKAIYSVPPGFSPKCNVREAKSSSFDEEVAPLILPGFPCKHVDEDQVTPLVPPGFPPKCNMVDATGSIGEDAVAPPVPPGFPLKCNMVEANGSVEGEGTLIIVSGISPNHNILKVKDVVKDKVAETVAISASNHDSIGNKEGRNDEKLASHCPSLSLDSHDEDQVTIAEMLKSSYKFKGVDCRDAKENSSGQCRSCCSSNSDKEHPICELITTVTAEKVMPAETAIKGSEGASIQDAIEIDDEEPVDKMVGNNGIQDAIEIDDDGAADKSVGNHGARDDTAAIIDDFLNEIALEERISLLERLVSQIKAERKIKSLATS